MSLISEVSKTVVDAKILETESVVANDVTTGSLVASDVVASTVSGSTTDSDANGLVVSGTITNATSVLPPLKLEGSGTSQSVANVMAEELGFSLAPVVMTDADYTVTSENQNGIYVYYNNTPLTADRTITLPSVHASTYSGTSHVYIRRRAAGAFNLTIDAGTANICGIATTTAGVFSSVLSSTIVSNATDHSVHLVHSPDAQNLWLIQGLSVGFV